MMPLLLATSNPHKIEEIAAVLEPLGIEVVGLDSLDVIPPEPVEDGNTFEANARLKAIGYARSTGQLCLADDSGLVVDALGGAPGIHSARYAGLGETRDERDRANNEKLLRELKDISEDQRSARFVCAMCLADEEGNVLAETRGEFPGLITNQPRGTNGFGYDPLLYLPDVDCTSAELSPADKNARSHRGHAARQMAEKLKEMSHKS
ncbi:MAG: RdgB/HAM1 family non-canonical purine NTP pyrophosphatase [Planctomycetes bacterium]|nr:RdgB/HAM1 family non-canonical purine NTP pyrophosphatase [Planctomycetota bacterium]